MSVIPQARNRYARWGRPAHGHPPAIKIERKVLNQASVVWGWVESENSAHWQVLRLVGAVGYNI